MVHLRPGKELTADDIKRLAREKVREDKTIEYKSKPPSKSEKDRSEFLKDASAFANADGGAIVYGIDEKRDSENHPTGLPGKIIGLPDTNVDSLKLRLENMLRSGVDPKLYGTTFCNVAVGKSTVLVLFIPRSLTGPHAHIVGGHCRFAVRTNAGTALMDVQKLRRAFVQSDSWEAAADNLRRERVMSVMNTDMVPALDTDYGFFIHLLPLASSINLPSYLLRDNVPGLLLDQYGVRSITHNLDGLLVTAGHRRVSGYVQGFRDGGAEVYWTTPRETGRRGDEEVPTISGPVVEKFVLGTTTEYLDYASALGVNAPYALYLTLTNVRDLYMFANINSIRHLDDDHKRFDRSDILLPACIIEDPAADVEESLTPVLDMLWQSGGWEESPLKKERREHRELYYLRPKECD